jgi:hypothetical protein
MPVKKPEGPKFAVTQASPANPYERDGKWWFYDETGCEYGPYRDEATASLELKHYCEIYLQAVRDMRGMPVAQIGGGELVSHEAHGTHGMFLNFYGPVTKESIANYVGFLQNGPIKVGVTLVDPATELYVNARKPTAQPNPTEIAFEFINVVVAVFKDASGKFRAIGKLPGPYNHCDVTGFGESEELALKEFEEQYRSGLGDSIHRLRSVRVKLNP